MRHADDTMSERYKRLHQAWQHEKILRLHMVVTKGMSLKDIVKALARSEDSTKN